jgi:hypothetical protein
VIRGSFYPNEKITKLNYEPPLRNLRTLYGPVRLLCSVYYFDRSPDCTLDLRPQIFCGEPIGTVVDMTNFTRAADFFQPGPSNSTNKRRGGMDMADDRNQNLGQQGGNEGQQGGGQQAPGRNQQDDKSAGGQQGGQKGGQQGGQNREGQGDGGSY